MYKSVHWWPEDRGSSKSWTEWDPEGFGTGVAGPFLKYVVESGMLSLFFSTKTTGVTNELSTGGA